MSNELVTECLKHKDSRNIQTRLDYMLLYRNETKAKVIRIMETWTNQKRAEWHKFYVENKEQENNLPEEPPEEALWVTMSYEEFSIYAYGTMNHDNIKKNVDALVKDEHLQRRPHLDIPYGPPQYLLDTGRLQELLNEQDIPSLFDDIGKIKPPRKKHTPPEKNPQGGGINTPRDGVNLPPGWGENTPPSKNPTKNLLESTKKTDMPSVIDFETSAKRITAGRLNVVAATETVSHIASDTIGNEQPTEKILVVKPLQSSTPGSVANPQSTTPTVQAQANSVVPAQRIDLSTPVEQATSQQTLTSSAARDDAALATAASPQSPGSGPCRSGLTITHAPTSPPVKQGKLSLKEEEPVVKVETPAQALRRLERRRDEYLKIYGEEIGRKPSRSKDNLDGATLCAQDEVPEEDFRKTIKAILADDFLAKNLSVAFVYKKLDALARKPSAPPAPPRQVNNLNGAAARLAARRVSGG